MNDGKNIEEKTGSSQVGVISTAQKNSRNNYSKHSEKKSFKKKYFLRTSHNAEKLEMRPFRLIKRFSKPKTSKKCKGVPFDRIRKFSKKMSRSAEKNQTKKTFGLASTFGSKIKLEFSARIEPTISCFAEN